MYNKSRREASLHGLWSGTDCHTECMDGGGGAGCRFPLKMVLDASLFESKIRDLGL